MPPFTMGAISVQNYDWRRREMLRIYEKDEVNGFLGALKNEIFKFNREVEESVSNWISDVRDNGDSAVRKYTLAFDKIDIDNFLLGEDEISKAAALCDAKLYAAMERAAANIYAYHERQRRESFFSAESGVLIGQKITPLQRVALYVPGGTAAYPSSVLMNAIPAEIAGVEEIMILTPPQKDGILPAVAAAAKIAGVNKIYTVGGAQAIAAAAFGTETIPRADKIVGPGNIYVATAKKLVYGQVDIDMIAGPSEILIIADEGANPVYIAADLMSQAEHDENARAILITTSKNLAEEVDKELEKQIQNLERRNIIEKSIKSKGAALIAEDIISAIKISNGIAPEHLELAVENAVSYLGGVKNAGAIFIGEYSPEPLGDYYAGTNHVLPTSGTARFASPLGVDNFVKKSGFVCYSKERLMASADDIIMFANSEGLTAHANSIKVRQPCDGGNSCDK